MSFIGVYHGYNRYSVFNISCDTNCLIDNIFTVCFGEVISQIDERKDQLKGIMTDYKNRQDAKEKEIATFEQDLSKQEQLIADKKKEEEERRIEEEKEAEKAKKDGKKDVKKTDKVDKKPTKTTKKGNEATEEEKVLEAIKITIEKGFEELKIIEAEKAKFEEKQAALAKVEELYKKELINYKEIDLEKADNGEKVFIYDKRHLRANEYLVAKECYEMMFVVSSNNLSRRPN